MAHLQADKIKKPLLLIHGEDDANSGTFPMQSERFYAALKGHGAVTRLVVLPHESHGYRQAPHPPNLHNIAILRDFLLALPIQVIFSDICSK